MSPRPKNIRRILEPPIISGFKPFSWSGNIHNSTSSEVVFLHFEEYESLRLCDYDGMDQAEAAKMMEVSRPTFTRIYMSARQKVAKAFVEGVQIKIEGGKVEFDKDWFKCASCGAIFNRMGSIDPTSCPICSSDEISNFIDL